MHMKVSHDQFEIDGDRLRHLPTGALFWMGQTDVVECDWGHAGTRFGNGNDYDREQLKQAAWEVFQIEKAKCV